MVVVVKSIRPILVLTEWQNFFFTPHGSSAKRRLCTASQRTLRNWYARRYIVSRDNPPPYGGIGIELLRKSVHFAAMPYINSRRVASGGPGSFAYLCLKSITIFFCTLQSTTIKYYSYSNRYFSIDSSSNRLLLILHLTCRRENNYLLHCNDSPPRCRE